MKSSREIFLTGETGFIGKNVISFFEKYPITFFNRNADCIINQEIVIHLAGKAHDLKKTYDSDDYYKVNTELTKKVFDAFLVSNAKVFITLSSVKAVVDKVEGELTEDHVPYPSTHYGMSKLLAEQYILSKEIPIGKRIYILRPCMIHGPGNKGNLNLLFKLVSKGVPWPLGSFENKRSFCSIDNLMFIIKELIQRDNIPSGIYNVADDDALSTNDVISILAKTLNYNTKIWRISKGLIQFTAKIGNVFNLPLNEERLQKLTDSYVVSNKKIKSAIAKPLPKSSKDGLVITFKSFK